MNTTQNIIVKNIDDKIKILSDRFALPIEIVAEIMKEWAYELWNAQSHIDLPANQVTEITIDEYSAKIYS